MLRAVLIFLLSIGIAEAQTCPGSNASWSFAIPSPMQWAVYDLAPPPGVSVGLLTVLYADRTAETFIGVPQTVAQQWQFSPNQTQFFNNRIRPVYHELLLIQGTNCPLLLNGTAGALWTK